MNLKHNQLTGKRHSFKAMGQYTTGGLLRGSLAFSVLSYLILAQTVAVVSSQHIASAQISPLQAAIQYNYKADQALLKQTAEMSAQLRNTLLPEIPALTVRLKQPAEKSNPLFFTLSNRVGFSPAQQQHPEEQQSPETTSQQKFVVINTKKATNYSFKQVQKSHQTPQAETTPPAEAFAKQSIVKTESSNVVTEATLADVHAYDYVTTSVPAKAAETPAAEEVTEIAETTEAEKQVNELLSEITPESVPDSALEQAPDTAHDSEALLSSKSFVSAIGNSGSSGYPFYYYELTLDNSILATEYDADGNPLTNDKSLALHGTTDATADSEDTTRAGVYEDNLPGLLAYDIIHPVVVVIDAGHGGVDPGTIGAQGLLEKDLTLDMARRLQALAVLHSDIDIVLSRNDSDGLSRAERVESVTAADADLLISLHFNSLPEGDITLVETYYTDAATPATYLDTANRLKQSATSLKANTAIRRPSTPFDTTDISRKLARHLQSRVFGAVQNRNPLAIDAGVKEESLFLLAQSGIPGALVELTCLSNEQEESRLRTEHYRNELAHSLMNALRKFVDSETLASSI